MKVLQRLEPAGASDASVGPSIFGRKLPVAHRETARALGMTEDAVKMAVRRLRRRFGTLLRDEVAQTVAGEDQVDAEIRSLLEAVRSA